jgi:hypothetical protein
LALFLQATMIDEEALLAVRVDAGSSRLQQTRTECRDVEHSVVFRTIALQVLPVCRVMVVKESLLKVSHVHPLHLQLVL